MFNFVVVVVVLEIVFNRNCATDLFELSMNMSFGNTNTKQAAKKNKSPMKGQHFNEYKYCSTFYV